MKIEFEFETKIDTGSKKKEKKISLSDIKEKAKKIAKDAAEKSNEAMIKAISNASEASLELLCQVADFAEATANAIDDYLENAVKSEKTFDEKLDEIVVDENLTMAELLELLDVYSEKKNLSDTVIAFFNNIGYPATELSYEAFLSVVGMEKITYDAVADKISETYEGISEEDIISELIGDFNDWLAAHTKVAEICAKPNLRYLMMYFAKKVKESEETVEE